MLEMLQKRGELSNFQVTSMYNCMIGVCWSLAVMVRNSPPIVVLALVRKAKSPVWLGGSKITVMKVTLVEKTHVLVYSYIYSYHLQRQKM